jgi:NTE family protein
MFLVVDSGRAPSGSWSQTVEGPAGANLITAASDTATESGAVGSYTSFQDTMREWQRALVDWRCRLSAADRRRFGAPAAWNCQDVRIFVGRVAFEQLDPQRAAALNAVETAFKLPPEQVDMVISAGHDAVKNSSVFRSFLASLGGAPFHRRPRGTPVAAPAMPAAAPQEAAAQ